MHDTCRRWFHPLGYLKPAARRQETSRRENILSGRTNCTFARLVAVFIVALATWTIGLGAAPVKAAERVVLQLRWDHQFQFAGYYAALWQGFYEQAGLDVVIRSAFEPAGKYQSVTREVAEGRAQFGTGAMDILSARDKGLPLVVVASVFQQSPVAFYAKAGTGLTSLSDLTRLRVAVKDPNGIANVELQAMLKAEGIDPALVKLQKTQGKLGLFDLAEGRADVVSGFTISAGWIARQLGIDITNLAPATYGVDFYGSAIFSNQGFVDNNPEVVRKFVAASLEGWAYALANSVKIADRIAAELPRTVPIGDKRGLNHFQIEPVKKLTLYPIIELGHTNPDRWRRMHAALKNAGVITGNFDSDRFIFDPAHDAARSQTMWLEILTYVIAGTLALAAVIILWNFALRRQVASQTAELAASEEKYRNLVEGSRQGVVIANQDHDILFCNQAVADIHGYSSPEEVMALAKSYRLAAKSERERLIQIREARFANKLTPSVFEFEGLRTNGETVPIQAVQRTLTWEGQPAIQYAIIDISAQKQALARLKESENRFRSYVDIASDWYFELDDQLRFTFISKGISAARGTPPDQLVGKTHAEALGEFAKHQTQQEYMALLDRRETVRGMLLCRERQDQDNLWARVSARPIYGDDGVFAGYRGVTSDMTDQMRAEEARRESEARLDGFFANAPIGLAIYDDQQRYLKVNEVLAEWNGLASEEHVGKALKDLFPAFKDVGDEEFQQILLTGEPQLDQEFVGTVPAHPDDNMTWLISRFPIPGPTGKPASVGSIVSDITDKKRADEEIRQLNVGLEQQVKERTAELEAAHAELLQQERLVTLGQLTATVSHELRNPLGVLRSSTYVLQSLLSGGNDAAAPILERLERNIVRCDRIIDELLDYTRIRPLVVEPIVLDDWLGAQLDEMNVPDGVEVVRELGSKGLKIDVDGETLRRAIVNLYDNAAQAMTDMDGAADCARRTLTVRTRHNGDNVDIIISDTGVGIADEVRARVFEPMFSTKGFGVGLGLPTVRQIAQQHRGTVELVANDEAPGTSAILNLPL